MPRILADFTDADIEWLDRLAAEQGTSRAALLREAVASFRAQAKDGIERGIGLWARKGFNEDGLAFQERVRKTADRL